LPAHQKNFSIMKLNNVEANLLASEIRNQIISKLSNVEVSPSLLKKINDYKAKYEKLKKAEADASVALEQHEDTWEEIIGANNIYASDSLPMIKKKLKEKNVPKLDDIKNKIILKGLFSKEEDMNEFVQKIVGEFTSVKKLTVS
jgi:hypothetical protein